MRLMPQRTKNMARTHIIIRTRPGSLWAIPVAITLGMLTWGLLTAYLPAAGIQFCRQAIQAARGAGR